MWWSFSFQFVNSLLMDGGSFMSSSPISKPCLAICIDLRTGTQTAEIAECFGLVMWVTLLDDVLVARASA